jgi:hypothetical protein
VILLLDLKQPTLDFAQALRRARKLPTAYRMVQLRFAPVWLEAQPGKLAQAHPLGHGLLLRAEFASHLARM